MLFRKVKAAYLRNHDKNITESRRAESADLIKLAQDGESRRVLSNTVMKIRVP
jgi:hypothetical protein